MDELEQRVREREREREERERVRESESVKENGIYGNTIGNLRNVTKFNAYVFVKCLETKLQKREGGTWIARHSFTQ